ncbi:MAG: hypothetical protein HQL99_14245 [Magnetococcales bacterium]|nr:hypothetical protein [Magnetococcales bacterium]
MSHAFTVRPEDADETIEQLSDAHLVISKTLRTGSVDPEDMEFWGSLLSLLSRIQTGIYIVVRSQSR